MIKKLSIKISKEISSLNQKKFRDKLNLYYIEGKNFIQDIKKDIKYYLISDSFILENPDFVFLENIDIYHCTDDEFKQISDTITPQGILAVIEKKHSTLSDLEFSNNDFFLVCKDIKDPGNLGTLIRTASACAIDGIFLSENTVDLYNPKTIRASAASFLKTKIYPYIDLNELLSLFKENNIKLIASTIDSKNSIYDFNYQSPLALFVGNESKGLSESLVNTLDIKATIPMPGKIESLNASVAASIFLYEILRQRL